MSKAMAEMCKLLKVRKIRNFHSASPDPGPGRTIQPNIKADVVKLVSRRRTRASVSPRAFSPPGKFPRGPQGSENVWSSPVVIVPTSDPKVCNDFCKLNEIWMSGRLHRPPPSG